MRFTLIFVFCAMIWVTRITARGKEKISPEQSTTSRRIGIQLPSRIPNPFGFVQENPTSIRQLLPEIQLKKSISRGKTLNPETQSNLDEKDDKLSENPKQFFFKDKRLTKEFLDSQFYVNEIRGERYSTDRFLDNQFYHLYRDGYDRLKDERASFLGNKWSAKKVLQIDTSTININELMQNVSLLSDQENAVTSFLDNLKLADLGRETSAVLEYYENEPANVTVSRLENKSLRGNIKNAITPYLDTLRLLDVTSKPQTSAVSNYENESDNLVPTSTENKLFDSKGVVTSYLDTLKLLGKKEKVTTTEAYEESQSTSLPKIAVKQKTLEPSYDRDYNGDQYGDYGSDYEEGPAESYEEDEKEDEEEEEDYGTEEEPLDWYEYGKQTEEKTKDTKPSTRTSGKRETILTTLKPTSESTTQFFSTVIATSTTTEIPAISETLAPITRKTTMVLASTNSEPETSGTTFSSTVIPTSTSTEVPITSTGASAPETTRITTELSTLFGSTVTANSIGIGSTETSSITETESTTVQISTTEPTTEIESTAIQTLTTESTTTESSTLSSAEPTTAENTVLLASTTSLQETGTTANTEVITVHTTGSTTQSSIVTTTSIPSTTTERSTTEAAASVFVTVVPTEAQTKLSSTLSTEASMIKLTSAEELETKSSVIHTITASPTISTISETITSTTGSTSTETTPTISMTTEQPTTTEHSTTESITTETTTEQPTTTEHFKTELMTTEQPTTIEYVTTESSTSVPTETTESTLFNTTLPITNMTASTTESHPVSTPSTETEITTVEFTAAISTTGSSPSSTEISTLLTSTETSSILMPITTEVITEFKKVISTATETKETLSTTLEMTEPETSLTTEIIKSSTASETVPTFLKEFSSTPVNRIVVYITSSPDFTPTETTAETVRELKIATIPITNKTITSTELTETTSVIFETELTIQIPPTTSPGSILISTKSITEIPEEEYEEPYEEEFEREDEDEYEEGEIPAVGEWYEYTEQKTPVKKVETTKSPIEKETIESTNLTTANSTEVSSISVSPEKLTIVLEEETSVISNGTELTSILTTFKNISMETTEEIFYNKTTEPQKIVTTSVPYNFPSIVSEYNMTSSNQSTKVILEITVPKSLTKPKEEFGNVTETISMPLTTKSEEMGTTEFRTTVTQITATAVSREEKKKLLEEKLQLLHERRKELAAKERALQEKERLLEKRKEEHRKKHKEKQQNTKAEIGKSILIGTTHLMTSTLVSTESTASTVEAISEETESIVSTTIPISSSSVTTPLITFFPIDVTNSTIGTTSAISSTVTNEIPTETTLSITSSFSTFGTPLSSTITSTIETENKSPVSVIATPISSSVLIEETSIISTEEISVTLSTTTEMDLDEQFEKLEEELEAMEKEIEEKEKIIEERETEFEKAKEKFEEELRKEEEEEIEQEKLELDQDEKKYVEEKERKLKEEMGKEKKEETTTECSSTLSTLSIIPTKKEVATTRKSIKSTSLTYSTEKFKFTPTFLTEEIIETEEAEPEETTKKILTECKDEGKKETEEEEDKKEERIGKEFEYDDEEEIWKEKKPGDVATTKLCLDVLKNGSSSRKKILGLATQKICLPSDHKQRRINKCKCEQSLGRLNRKLFALDGTNKKVSSNFSAILLSKRNSKKNTAKFGNFNLRHHEWVGTEPTKKLPQFKGFTKIYQRWTEIPFEPITTATRRGCIEGTAANEEKSHGRKQWFVNKHEKRMKPSRVDRLNNHEWIELSNGSKTRHKNLKDEEEIEEGEEQERKNIGQEQEAEIDEFPPEYEENCEFQLQRYTEEKSTSTESDFLASESTDGDETEKYEETTEGEDKVEAEDKDTVSPEYEEEKPSIRTTKKCPGQQEETTKHEEKIEHDETTESQETTTPGKTTDREETAEHEETTENEERTGEDDATDYEETAKDKDEMEYDETTGDEALIEYEETIEPEDTSGHKETTEENSEHKGAEESEEVTEHKDTTGHGEKIGREETTDREETKRHERTTEHEETTKEEEETTEQTTAQAETTRNGQTTKQERKETKHEETTERKETTRHEETRKPKETTKREQTIKQTETKKHEETFEKNGHVTEEGDKKHTDKSDDKEQKKFSKEPEARDHQRTTPKKKENATGEEDYEKETTSHTSEKSSGKDEDCEEATEEEIDHWVQYEDLETNYTEPERRRRRRRESMKSLTRRLNIFNSPQNWINQNQILKTQIPSPYFTEDDYETATEEHNRRNNYYKIKTRKFPQKYFSRHILEFPEKWPTERTGHFHIGGSRYWDIYHPKKSKLYKTKTQSYTVNALRLEYDEDEETNKLKCIPTPSRDELIINEDLTTRDPNNVDTIFINLLGTDELDEEDKEENDETREEKSGNYKHNLFSGVTETHKEDDEGRDKTSQKESSDKKISLGKKQRHEWPRNEWPTERITKYHVGGTKSWRAEIDGRGQQINEYDKLNRTTCYHVVLKNKINPEESQLERYVENQIIQSPIKRQTMLKKPKIKLDYKKRQNSIVHKEKLLASRKPNVRTIQSMEYLEPEENEEEKEEDYLINYADDNSFPSDEMNQEKLTGSNEIVEKNNYNINRKNCDTFCDETMPTKNFDKEKIKLTSPINKDNVPKSNFVIKNKRDWKRKIDEMDKFDRITNFTEKIDLTPVTINQKITTEEEKSTEFNVLLHIVAKLKNNSAKNYMFHSDNSDNKKFTETIKTTESYKNIEDIKFTENPENFSMVIPQTKIPVFIKLENFEYLEVKNIHRLPNTIYVIYKCTSPEVIAEYDISDEYFTIPSTTSDENGVFSDIPISLDYHTLTTNGNLQTGTESYHTTTESIIKNYYTTDYGTLNQEITPPPSTEILTSQSTILSTITDTYTTIEPTITDTYTTTQSTMGDVTMPPTMTENFITVQAATVDNYTSIPSTITDNYASMPLTTKSNCVGMQPNGKNNCTTKQSTIIDNYTSQSTPIIDFTTLEENLTSENQSTRTLNETALSLLPLWTTISSPTSAIVPLQTDSTDETTYNPEDTVVSCKMFSQERPRSKSLEKVLNSMKNDNKNDVRKTGSDYFYGKKISGSSINSENNLPRKNVGKKSKLPKIGKGNNNFRRVKVLNKIKNKDFTQNEMRYRFLPRKIFRDNAHGRKENMNKHAGQSEEKKNTFGNHRHVQMKEKLPFSKISKYDMKKINSGRNRFGNGRKYDKYTKDNSNQARVYNNKFNYDKKSKQIKGSEPHRNYFSNFLNSKNGLANTKIKDKSNLIPKRRKLRRSRRFKKKFDSYISESPKIRVKRSENKNGENEKKYDNSKNYKIKKNEHKNIHKNLLYDYNNQIKYYDYNYQKKKNLHRSLLAIKNSDDKEDANINNIHFKIIRKKTKEDYDELSERNDEDIFKDEISEKQSIPENNLLNDESVDDQYLDKQFPDDQFTGNHVKERSLLDKVKQLIGNAIGSNKINTTINKTNNNTKVMVKQKKVGTAAKIKSEKNKIPQKRKKNKKSKSHPADSEPTSTDIPEKHSSQKMPKIKNTKARKPKKKSKEIKNNSSKLSAAKKDLDVQNFKKNLQAFQNSGNKNEMTNNLSRKEKFQISELTVSHPKKSNLIGNINGIVPAIKELIQKQQLGNIEKIIVYVDSNGDKSGKTNFSNKKNEPIKDSEINSEKRFEIKGSKENMNVERKNEALKNVDGSNEMNFLNKNEKVTIDNDTLRKIVKLATEKILQSISEKSIRLLNPRISVKVMQPVAYGGEKGKDFTIDLSKGKSNLKTHSLNPKKESFEKMRKRDLVNLNEDGAGGSVPHENSVEPYVIPVKIPNEETQKNKRRLFDNGYDRRMDLPIKSKKKRNYWRQKYLRQKELDPSFEFLEKENSEKKSEKVENDEKGWNKVKRMAEIENPENTVKAPQENSTDLETKEDPSGDNFSIDYKKETKNEKNQRRRKRIDTNHADNNYDDNNISENNYEHESPDYAYDVKPEFLKYESKSDKNEEIKEKPKKEKNISKSESKNSKSNHDSTTEKKVDKSELLINKNERNSLIDLINKMKDIQKSVNTTLNKIEKRIKIQESLEKFHDLKQKSKNIKNVDSWATRQLNIVLKKLVKEKTERDDENMLDVKKNIRKAISELKNNMASEDKNNISKTSKKHHYDKKKESKKKRKGKHSKKITEENGTEDVTESEEEKDNDEEERLKNKKRLDKKKSRPTKKKHEKVSEDEVHIDKIKNKIKQILNEESNAPKRLNLPKNKTQVYIAPTGNLVSGLVNQDANEDDSQTDLIEDKEIPKFEKSIDNNPARYKITEETNEKISKAKNKRKMNQRKLKKKSRRNKFFFRKPYNEIKDVNVFPQLKHEINSSEGKSDDRDLTAEKTKSKTFFGKPNRGERKKIGRRLCVVNKRNNKKFSKKKNMAKEMLTKNKQREKNLSSKGKRKPAKIREISQTRAKNHKISKNKKKSEKNLVSRQGNAVEVKTLKNDDEINLQLLTQSVDCLDCICDLTDTFDKLRSTIEVIKDPEDIRTFECTRFKNLGKEIVVTNNIRVNKKQRFPRFSGFERLKSQKYIKPDDLKNVLKKDIDGINESIVSQPGVDLTVPCNQDRGISWISSFNKPFYTWSRPDGAPHSGSVRRNGDLEFHDIEPKDAGNYICTVSYVDPDTEQEVENIYATDIQILTVPNYMVHGENHYHVQACDETDLDALSFVFPQKLNEILCTRNICDAYIVSHYCSLNKIFLNILVMPLYAINLTPIGSRQCDLLCFKAVQDKIALLIIENLKRIFGKTITFRFDHHHSNLVPEKALASRTKRGKSNQDFGKIGLLLSCPAGYGLHSTHCVPCSPGFYSEDGMSHCRKCSSGTYQPNVGANACRACANPFLKGCFSMLWNSSINIEIILTALAIIILVPLLITCILCCVKSKRIVNICSKSSNAASDIQQESESQMLLNTTSDNEVELYKYEQPKKKKRRIVMRRRREPGSERMRRSNTATKQDEVEMQRCKQKVRQNQTVPISRSNSYRSQDYEDYSSRKLYVKKPPVPLPDFDS